MRDVNSLLSRRCCNDRSDPCRTALGVELGDPPFLAIIPWQATKKLICVSALIRRPSIHHVVRFLAFDAVRCWVELRPTWSARDQ